MLVLSLQTSRNSCICLSSTHRSTEITDVSILLHVELLCGSWKFKQVLTLAWQALLSTEPSPQLWACFLSMRKHISLWIHLTRCWTAMTFQQRWQPAAVTILNASWLINDSDVPPGLWETLITNRANRKAVEIVFAYITTAKQDYKGYACDPSARVGQFE